MQAVIALRTPSNGNTYCRKTSAVDDIRENPAQSLDADRLNDLKLAKARIQGADYR